MFVNKEYRGATHKTASLLLDTAIKWAKERPIKALSMSLNKKEKTLFN